MRATVLNRFALQSFETKAEYSQCYDPSEIVVEPEEEDEEEGQDEEDEQEEEGDEEEEENEEE